MSRSILTASAALFSFLSLDGRLCRLFLHSRIPCLATGLVLVKLHGLTRSFQCHEALEDAWESL